MNEEKETQFVANGLSDDELESVNGGFGDETPDPNEVWTAECNDCGAKFGPFDREGTLWGPLNYHYIGRHPGPSYTIWHNGVRV